MSEASHGSHRKFRLPAPYPLVSRAVASLAVLGTVAGLSLADSSAALAANGGAGYNGVFISEVQSHGAGNDDATLANGDWIELYNSTDAPVDMTGAILADSSNKHAYVIGTNSPAGTATIPADSYQAYRVDSSDNTGDANFGLGDQDEARLYAPDSTVGTTTPADEFDWNHSPVNSWARDFADDGGDPASAVWKASAEATLNGANVFSATSPSLSGIKINEVNMNGGADGDWVELTNTGRSTVTLTGAVLSDNDPSDAYVIGSDPSDAATIAPGKFVTYQVDAATHDGNFGLGNDDSIELYPSSVTDLSGAPTNPAASTPTAVLAGSQDSYSWTTAPTFTYGREPDGTGAFEATTGPTFDESNADAPQPGGSLAGVVINEVKTTGDPTHGDWVELYNSSDQSVDLSGAIVSDDNNSHAITINSGVMLGAGDYLAITTDEDTTDPFVDPNATGTFGLGDADSIRLFTAGTPDLATATPVDSFSWTQHALTSYGRMAGADIPDDSADWAETNNATFGGANDFTNPTDYTSDPQSFIQINEIESTDNTGDPFPNNDWVELVNTSPNPVDVNGMVLSDSEDTHSLVLNSSDIDEVGNACIAGDVSSDTTTIPAGQFAVVLVDDSDITGNFGLGSSDAVRLYQASNPAPITAPTPGVSIPVDHEEWSAQPTGSYQRQLNGLGGWVDGAASTQTALEPNTGCGA